MLRAADSWVPSLTARPTRPPALAAPAGARELWKLPKWVNEVMSPWGRFGIDCATPPFSIHKALNPLAVTRLFPPALLLQNMRAMLDVRSGWGETGTSSYQPPSAEYFFVPKQKIKFFIDLKIEENLLYSDTQDVLSFEKGCRREFASTTEIFFYRR